MAGVGKDRRERSRSYTHMALGKLKLGFSSKRNLYSIELPLGQLVIRILGVYPRKSNLYWPSCKYRALLTNVSNVCMDMTERIKHVEYSKHTRQYKGADRK